jgi:opacity protein-like surface antigen
MSCRRILLPAIAACAALVAGSAKLEAADLGSFFGGSTPPDASEPEQPVEFGTGWYLRGDVAYARDSLPEVDSFGVFYTGQSPRNTYSLGIGGGYKFNQWFRTDLTLDFREPLGAQDPSTGSDATGERWDALANGYVDLGTWSGFTPYIGAGVGAAFGRTKVTTMDTAVACTQNGTIVCEFSNTPISLAWALMAGVAFEIFPHAYIDVGYRYLNLGTYSFYPSSDWPALNAAGVPAALQSNVQEIRVGFRYMID